MRRLASIALESGPDSIAHNGTTYLRADRVLAELSAGVGNERENGVARPGKAAPAPPMGSDPVPDDPVINEAPAQDNLAMLHVPNPESAVVATSNVPSPPSGVDRGVEDIPSLTGVFSNLQVPGMNVAAGMAGSFNGLINSMINSPMSQQGMSSGSGYNISSTHLQKGRPPVVPREFEHKRDQLYVTLPYMMQNMTMDPDVDNYYITDRNPFDFGAFLSTPRIVDKITMVSSGAKASIREYVIDNKFILDAYNNSSRARLLGASTTATTYSSTDVGSFDAILVSYLARSRYRVRMFITMHLTLFERCKVAFMAAPSQLYSAVPPYPTNTPWEAFFTGFVHDFSESADVSFLLPFYEPNLEPDNHDGQPSTYSGMPYLRIFTQCGTYFGTTPPKMEVRLCIEPTEQMAIPIPSVFAEGDSGYDLAEDKQADTVTSLIPSGIKMPVTWTVRPEDTKKVISSTAGTTADLLGDFELFSTITYSGLLKDIPFKMIPIAPSAFSQALTDTAGTKHRFCSFAEVSRYFQYWSGSIVFNIMVVNNFNSGGKIAFVHWPYNKRGATEQELKGMHQVVLDMSVAKSATLVCMHKVGHGSRLMINPTYNSYLQYGYDGTSALNYFKGFYPNGSEIDSEQISLGWIMALPLSTLKNDVTAGTGALEVAWSVRPGPDFQWFMPIPPAIEQARPITEAESSDDYDLRADGTIVLSKAPFEGIKDPLERILKIPRIDIYSVGTDWIEYGFNTQNFTGYNFASDFFRLATVQPWMVFDFDLPRGSAGKIEFKILAPQGKTVPETAVATTATVPALTDPVLVSKSSAVTLTSYERDSNRTVAEYRVPVGPGEPTTIRFDFPRSRLFPKMNLATYKIMFRADVRLYNSTTNLLSMAVYAGFGPETAVFDRVLPQAAIKPQWGRFGDLPEAQMQDDYDMLDEGSQTAEPQCEACGLDCPGFCPDDLFARIVITGEMLRNNVRREINGLGITTMRSKFVPECERTTAPAINFYEDLKFEGQEAWAEYLRHHYALNMHHPESKGFADNHDMHKVRVIDVFSSLTRSTHKLRDAWKISMGVLAKDEGFCRECYTTTARELYLFISRGGTVPFGLCMDRPCFHIIQWRKPSYILESWSDMVTMEGEPIRNPYKIEEILGDLIQTPNNELTPEFNALIVWMRDFPPLKRCMKEIYAHIESVRILTYKLYPSIVERHDHDKMQYRMLYAYFLKWGLGKDVIPKKVSTARLKEFCQWSMNKGFVKYSFEKCGRQRVRPQGPNDYDEVESQGITSALGQVISYFRPKVLDDISSAANSVTTTANIAQPVIKGTGNIIGAIEGPIKTITNFVQGMRGMLTKHLGDEIDIGDVIAAFVALYNVYAAPAGLTKLTAWFMLLREIGMGVEMISTITEAMNAVSGGDENLNLNRVYRVTRGSTEGADPIEGVLLEDVTDQIEPNGMTENIYKLGQSLLKDETVKLGIPFVAFSVIGTFFVGKLKHPQASWLHFLKGCGSIAKDIMAITAASFLAYESLTLLITFFFKIKEYFEDWYAGNYGLSKTTRDYLANVEKWHKELEELLTFPLQTFMGNAVQMQRIHTAAATGAELIKELCASDELKHGRWGLVTHNTLKDGMKLLEERVRALQMMAKDDPTRITPFAIRLIGAPGIGKSSFMERLALHLAVSCNAPLAKVSDAFYTWDVSSNEKFQEAYHNQPVVLLDDPELPTTDSEWLYTIQKMISKTPFNVPKAAIEAKGWWFKSSAVILSTNVGKDAIRAAVHSRCPEAYLRRFMHVKVEKRANVPFDKNYGHLKFTIERPELATAVWKESPGLKMEEFLTIVKSAFTAHMAREQSILDGTEEMFHQVFPNSSDSDSSSEDEPDSDLEGLLNATGCKLRGVNNLMRDSMQSRRRPNAPNVTGRLPCGCPKEVVDVLPENIDEPDVGLASVVKHSLCQSVGWNRMLFVNGKVSPGARFEPFTPLAMAIAYMKAQNRPAILNKRLYNMMGLDKYAPHITADFFAWVHTMWNDSHGSWSVISSLLITEPSEIEKHMKAGMKFTDGTMQLLTNFRACAQQVADLEEIDSEGAFLAVTKAFVQPGFENDLIFEVANAIQMIIYCSSEIDNFSRRELPMDNESSQAFATDNGHETPVDMKNDYKGAAYLEDYDKAHLRVFVYENAKKERFYRFSTESDIELYSKVVDIPESRLESLIQGEMTFVDYGNLLQSLRDEWDKQGGAPEALKQLEGALSVRILLRRWYRGKEKFRSCLIAPSLRMWERMPRWAKRLTKILGVMAACQFGVLLLSALLGKSIPTPVDLAISGTQTVGRAVVAVYVKDQDGNTKLVEANGNPYETIRRAQAAPKVTTASPNGGDLQEEHEGIFKKSCVSSLGTISVQLYRENQAMRGYHDTCILAIGGGWYITTGHHWKTLDVSKVTGKVFVQFPKVWSEQRFDDMEIHHPWPNTDLSLFRFRTGYVEMFPNIVKHFVQDADFKRLRRGVPVRFVSLSVGAERPTARTVEEAQTRPLEHRTVCLKADLVSAETSVLQYAYDTPKGRSVMELARYWSYDKAGKGLCGSPIFCTNGATPRILGIHVAGTQGARGFSSIVTREMLEEFLSRNDFGICSAETAVDIDIGEPVIDYGTDNPVIPMGDYSFYGELAKEHHTHMPPTHGFIKMPTFDLIEPNDREPAPSRNNDERNVFGENMIRNCAEKYNVVAEPIPSDLMNLFEGGFSQFLDGIDDSGIIMLNQDESINGIEGSYVEPMNVRTAPGFPFVRMAEAKAGGKRGFLVDLSGDPMNPRYGLTDNMQERVDRIIVLGARGELAQTFYQDALKVELLPLEKTRPYEHAVYYGGENVDGPIPIYCGPKKIDERLPTVIDQIKPTRTWKPRLLSVPGMDRTIVARLFNAGFNNFLMENRHRTGIMVGINPESSEWLMIANRLWEVSDLVNDNDFKNFDGCHQTACILMVGRIYSKFLERDPVYRGSPELRNLQRALWHELAQRNVVCQKWAYRVHHGLASGHDCTTQVNCILQIFYFFVAWCLIMREEKRFDLVSFSVFWKNVRCIVYGDDGLMSVRSEYGHLFSSERIASVLAKFSIQMTPADKFAKSFPPPRKITEVTFLSRGFVPHPSGPNIFYAPLKLESVNALLNWVYIKHRPQNLAVAQNIEEHLRHYYPQGERKYNKRLALIRKIMKERDPDVDLSLLPTWIELETNFLVNWGLV